MGDACFSLSTPVSDYNDSPITVGVTVVFAILKNAQHGLASTSITHETFPEHSKKEKEQKKMETKPLVFCCVAHTEFCLRTYEEEQQSVRATCGVRADCCSFLRRRGLVSCVDYGKKGCVKDVAL